jgi:hypothetical protein
MPNSLGRAEPLVDGPDVQRRWAALAEVAPVSTITRRGVPLRSLEKTTDDLPPPAVQSTWAQPESSFGGFPAESSEGTSRWLIGILQRVSKSHSFSRRPFTESLSAAATSAPKGIHLATGFLHRR